MSFDWQSYISLAEELLELSQKGRLEEACLRSATSRSYYGVFCIARNFLKKNGISIPPIDTHKFVRERYMKSSNVIKRKIGEDLKRLWRQRKESDYEDIANINITGVRTAINLAKRVLESLRNIGAI
jgi:uncharacterized protein (UPF0332 family)